MTNRVFAALVLLAILCGTAPALAHRVNVFAVLENGVVTGEGYFGGGSKAQDCRVDILDQAGTVQASGRTGEDGTFRVELPGTAAGPFTVALAAGEGHRAEYRLAATPDNAGAPGAAPAGKTADAVRAPSGLTGGAAAQEAPASLPAGPASSGTAAAKSTQAGGAPAAGEPLAASPGVAPSKSPPVASLAQPPVDPAEARLAALVQAAAAKAVEEKLAPLKLELARLADAEHSTRVRDIVGGLGWIVGMVGLAAWFKRPGS